MKLESGLLPEFVNPQINPPAILTSTAQRFGAIWRLLSLITLLYLALVLLRHYSFDTYTYDLGIFDQGAWRYSQLQVPYSSIKGFNLLGDHFTPVLALAAPFYWISNRAETLLILQVLAVMSGVIPAYQLSRKYLKSGLSNYPPLFYALFFGIQSALEYDFHTDTIAAGAFMWAIWAYEARYIKLYLAFLGLVLLCKETFPAYLSFWALYVLIHRWNEPKQRYLHIGLFFGGWGLFFVELNLVLPFLAGKPYGYNDYGDLGHSLVDVASTFLHDPSKILPAFFGDPAKRETWVVFCIASGGAFFIRPALLLMLVPNVVERFLNNSPIRWTVQCQYNAILAAFYTYAVVLALAAYEQHNGRWRKVYLHPTPFKLWLCCILVLNTFTYSSFMSNGPLNIMYLIQDNSAVWAALNRIPPEASVQANARLVPHLTHRAEIHDLLSPEDHHWKFDMDYIIISLSIERDYDIQVQLAGIVNYLLLRNDYRLIYENDQNYIFQRTISGAPAGICRDVRSG